MSNRSEKSAQIIAGLRQLQAGQKHGQTFTVTEIAAACGICQSAASLIAREAEAKFAARLIDSCGPMLTELLGAAPIKECAGRIRAKQFGRKTSIPSIRGAREVVKRIPSQVEREGIAGLYEVSRILARRNAAANFKNRRGTL